jgi:hypothetical protein
MMDDSMLNMLQSFISSPEKSQSRFMMRSGGSRDSIKELRGCGAENQRCADDMFVQQGNVANSTVAALPNHIAFAKPALRASQQDKDAHISAHNNTDCCSDRSSSSVGSEEARQEKQPAETTPSQCNVQRGMQVAAAVHAVEKVEEAFPLPPPEQQSEQQQSEQQRAPSVPSCTTSPPLSSQAPRFAHISVLSANKRPAATLPPPSSSFFMDQERERQAEGQAGSREGEFCSRSNREDPGGRSRVQSPAAAAAACASADSAQVAAMAVTTTVSATAHSSVIAPREDALLLSPAWTATETDQGDSDRVLLENVPDGRNNLQGSRSAERISGFVTDNTGSNSAISSGSSGNSSHSTTSTFDDKRERDSETLIDDSENEIYHIPKSNSESYLPRKKVVASVFANACTGSHSHTHTLQSTTPTKTKKKDETKSCLLLSPGVTAVFSGVSTSSSGRQSSCGISPRVMRRHNRKPHMKRINPTFVRKLSSSVENNKNTFIFG